jgi:hypothetical protein
MRTRARETSGSPAPRPPDLAAGQLQVILERQRRDDDPDGAVEVEDRFCPERVPSQLGQEVGELVRRLHRRVEVEDVHREQRDIDDLLQAERDVLAEGALEADGHRVEQRRLQGLCIRRRLLGRGPPDPGQRHPGNDVIPDRQCAPHDDVLCHGCR